CSAEKSGFLEPYDRFLVDGPHVVCKKHHEFTVGSRFGAGKHATAQNFRLRVIRKANVVLHGSQCLRHILQFLVAADEFDVLDGDTGSERAEEDEELGGPIFLCTITEIHRPKLL